MPDAYRAWVRPGRFNYRVLYKIYDTHKLGSLNLFSITLVAWFSTPPKARPFWLRWLGQGLMLDLYGQARGRIVGTLRTQNLLGR